MLTIDYKTAGVDVAAGNETVHRIKGIVEKTFSPQVLNKIGGFSSLYDLRDLMQHYRHPVLVQSIDGVGTKMMVAQRMQKFDTIGIDLVSATTNDIIVMGAKPLTLLDYIANANLQPAIVAEIITGMAQACLAEGIALVGGETAEMPGTYLPGEMDLVGVITGVVEKEEAILGKDIAVNDIVLAFSSSGLHTNGYSLARKLLFEIAGYDVDSYCQEFSRTLGEELLEPHLNYTRPILHLLEQKCRIKGIAHITGGGLLENIPRILPPNCSVEIVKDRIPTQPIFHLLRHWGQLDDYEMYRTFNMGAGLVLFLASKHVDAVKTALQPFPHFPLYEIGRVIPGNREVLLT